MVLHGPRVGPGPRPGPSPHRGLDSDSRVLFVPSVTGSPTVFGGEGGGSETGTTRKVEVCPDRDRRFPPSGSSPRRTGWCWGPWA